jgi:hypothetical protein
MKHLLSGTAIAFALAIAAPAWAQTSASSMTPSPSAPSATSVPTGSHMRSHRVKARHHRATRHGSARSSDNVANQLNAQQAAGNPGGGMGGAPAPAYGGRRTGPYGQPNQIYGMPGAGQPSASSDYPSGPGPAYVPGQGGPRTGPYGQPNQIYGMPGAGQPSASSSYPSGPGPAYVPGQYQSSPSPNAPAQTR